MTDRLRQFTSQCAGYLGGPWEGKLQTELADLVGSALNSPSASSTAAAAAATAGPPGDPDQHASTKGSKEKKEKKEKKAKGEVERQG